MSMYILWQRSEQDTETVEAFNPHLSYVYKDRSVIEDASSLILHHMKRQAGEWGWGGGIHQKGEEGLGGGG